MDKIQFFSQIQANQQVCQTKYIYPAVLLLSVDDLHKVGFKRGASNKEAVNVSRLSQLLAVAGRDGASVNDAQGVRHLGGDLLLQPLAQFSVHFLSLLMINQIT